MHPVFNLFGIDIAAYGLLGGLAVLALYLYFLTANDRAGAARIPRDQAAVMVLVMAITGLVGARLLGLIVELARHSIIWQPENGIPALLEKLIGGSRVFYGSLFGALLGAWCYC